MYIKGEVLYNYQLLLVESIKYFYFICYVLYSLNCLSNIINRVKMIIIFEKNNTYGIEVIMCDAIWEIRI